MSLGWPKLEKYIAHTLCLEHYISDRTDCFKSILNTPGEGFPVLETYFRDIIFDKVKSCNWRIGRLLSAKISICISILYTYVSSVIPIKWRWQSNLMHKKERIKDSPHSISKEVWIGGQCLKSDKDICILGNKYTFTFNLQKVLTSTLSCSLVYYKQNM